VKNRIYKLVVAFRALSRVTPVIRARSSAARNNLSATRRSKNASVSTFLACSGPPASLKNARDNILARLPSLLIGPLSS
jgi:hypothetical protein